MGWVPGRRTRPFIVIRFFREKSPIDHYFKDLREYNHGRYDGTLKYWKNVQAIPTPLNAYRPSKDIRSKYLNSAKQYRTRFLDKL
jgi:hypothetical protein